MTPLLFHVQDVELRYWVLRCAIGAVASSLAFLAWVCIFQLKWRDWHMEVLLMA